REHPRLHVLADGLQRELRHLLRVVDREDEVRGMPRGTAWGGGRPLVEQDEVSPAELREVVREAVADNACADHHGPGSGRPLICLWHTTDISRHCSRST